MKLLLAVALAATGPGSGGVILGDSLIGTYRVKQDGSLLGAVTAFGTPATRQLRDETCYVSWPSHGLRMTFYNLGGASPCGPRGRFGTATITGRGWRTSKGLRVGAPAADIAKYFPRARYRRDAYFGNGWWLIWRFYAVGTPGYYPGLLARTANGRVSALVVRFPAGGD
jgi:hypothetical protein